MIEQTIVFGTLFFSLVLFVTGKIRYDIVALLALLAVSLTGIVSSENVFSGFGHPAVVTVAAVLVVSKGLENSGMVDLIASWMRKTGTNVSVQIFTLTFIVCVLSAFMNNVGALALMMPVAIGMARKTGQPASIFLMPLSFGSLLGGLITLIGTPPNIIIASYREEVSGQAFSMFDFSPVGAGIAFVGVLFISLVGWRLLPHRKGAASNDGLFNIEDYVTELLVPVGSEFAGKAVGEIENLSEGSSVIVGIIRGDENIPAPVGFFQISEEDILIVKSDSESLGVLIKKTGFEMEGSRELKEEILKSNDVGLVEAVVTPESNVIGRTAEKMFLRLRHGVNLLAVARQDEQIRDRISTVKFRSGDVLLFQGKTDSIQETLSKLGCLPLADRGLRLGEPTRILLALFVFIFALGLSAFNVLPVHLSFVTCAVTMNLLGLISLRQAYSSIDWPVIVLLGAMIPVGQAMETTGGAKIIADYLLMFVQGLPAWATLMILIAGTSLLSNIINNAAAAVLMAPIGIGVAQSLGGSIDPFLMAVAIGSSSAFLTPIGHQSNTLVMRPGGYQFNDYWKMGLPIEIIVILMAPPLLTYFWPM